LHGLVVTMLDVVNYAVKEVFSFYSCNLFTSFFVEQIYVINSDHRGQLMGIMFG
jgi:hypothetical protein